MVCRLFRPARVASVDPYDHRFNFRVGKVVRQWAGAVEPRS
jgi:hypothetical protein